MAKRNKEIKNKMKPSDVITKTILWAGPGKYRTYRDRDSLECIWVPYNIVPNNKVLIQDATTIKNLPKTFIQVDKVRFEDGKLLNAKGEEMENKPENVCEAFEWGWNKDNEFCIACKDNHQEEYTSCQALTEIKYAELRKTGWFYYDDELWQSPGFELGKNEVKETTIEAYDLFRTDVAYDLYLKGLAKENKEDEGGEKVAAKMEEKGKPTPSEISNCPFESDSKAAVLYNVIQEGGKTQSEAAKEAAKLCVGEYKKNYDYMYAMFAKWKKGKIISNKSREKLIIVDGICGFELLPVVKGE